MLIQRLSEMQISIDTIDKNYVRGFPKQRLLKLNVSNVKEDRIEKGIRIVMEEIKQAERLNFQFKKNKMGKEVCCETQNNSLVCVYRYYNWSCRSN